MSDNIEHLETIDEEKVVVESTVDKWSWKKPCEALLSNLLSFKLWLIVGIIWVSAWLTYLKLMTGGEFVTLNTTIVTAAISMREITKIRMGIKKL